MSSPFRARLSRAASVAVVATAGLLATPAAPAHAVTCGPLVPCVVAPVGGVPDLTGEVKGMPCMGLFVYEGPDDAGDQRFEGPLQGATYAHSDVQVRSLTVTCSVRTGSTDTAGQLRGDVSATSTAPFTFVASAAGRELVYYRTNASERVWLCTTVRWVDRFGFPHTHRYDWDPNTPGAQCGELIRLVDA
jgi:hypothetical protein